MEAWNERKWCHKSVDSHFCEKDYSKSHLNGATFAEFISQTLPMPQHMTKTRNIIFKESADVSGHRTRKFRAFTALMFPPLKIRNRSIQSVCPDTFYGDSLPQFRVQGRGHSISYKCVPCELMSKEDWRPPRLEGLKQLFEHAKSKSHSSSCSGLQEMNHRPPTSMYKHKEVQQKQKSIDEFYGSQKPHTRCYHIHNAEMLDAFKDDQFIHKMSNDKKWSSDKSL